MRRRVGSARTASGGSGRAGLSAAHDTDPALSGGAPGSRGAPSCGRRQSPDPAGAVTDAHPHGTEPAVPAARSPAPATSPGTPLARRIPSAPRRLPEAAVAAGRGTGAGPPDPLPRRPTDEHPPVSPGTGRGRGPAQHLHDRDLLPARRSRPGHPPGSGSRRAAVGARHAGARVRRHARRSSLLARGGPAVRDRRRTGRRTGASGRVRTSARQPGARGDAHGTLGRADRRARPPGQPTARRGRLRQPRRTAAARGPAAGTGGDPGRHGSAAAFAGTHRLPQRHARPPTGGSAGCLRRTPDSRRPAGR